MALTLADAAKLSNDVVLQGLIENTISADPVLWNLLPWEQVNGNAVKYNRELALPTVAAKAVGDVWTEDAITITQITTALAIYGGDSDVDNFMALTRSNIQDPMAIAALAKMKALRYKLSDQLVYGSGAANEMSGFQTLVPNAGQRVHQGAAGVGAALSLANLDLLIDTIRPGKPDMLMMNRNVRRRLSQYARGNGSPVIFPIERFGAMVMHYGDIPIGVNDFMPQTETITGTTFTAKTGGVTSSIIAVFFGQGGLDNPEGSAMLFGGPTPIQVEEVAGPLETKDANRIRVKSYCALANFNALHIAVLDGITDVAVVA